jgi:hypothetical protein
MLGDAASPDDTRSNFRRKVTTTMFRICPTGREPRGAGRLRHRTSRSAVAGLLLGTVGAASLAACAGSNDVAQQVDGSDSGPVTMSYTGRVQSYDIPADVNLVNITASGGGGGGAHIVTTQAAGALIDGNLKVHSGQALLVSVGQAGAGAGDTDDDPQGGWGGLGARGGNGNAAEDYLRTSGAGGGASTIQLTNLDGSDPQTVLIAGGGGGTAGPSGDAIVGGSGGSGGCRDNSPSWTGSDGSGGSSLHGGKGGAAGALPNMAGARGKGGSGLGGNPGGSGGGLQAGKPGTGGSLCVRLM